MADNGGDTSAPPKFLEPPAVTALRQEARSTSPSPSNSNNNGNNGNNGNDSASPAPMQRSLSQDMREECEELKEAAEQTLNVVMDLDMDGRIKWVSPSWKEAVGTEVEDAEGQMVSDIVRDNKSVFDDAVESLKRDDSRSQIVRFAVTAGPASVLRHRIHERRRQRDDESTASDRGESEAESSADEMDKVLNLEGQGIMVHETSGTSHTMWMLRPASGPREVTIGLPPLLIESLGVGAEMLANYLTVLAEVGINDPAHHPPPMPILCRICERQITPWWFEKHTELCLQDHRAEMEVQIAQENLNEHRNSIVKVLDILESRHGRTGNAAEASASQAEYKSLPIGRAQSTTPSSGLISGSSSSSGTPPRSRDPSTSGLGHGRARSFAVRRPLARVVELVLDLCDTALEIETPALKESRTDAGDEVRTQSPQSESRISQVLQWQSPSSNTLEQEQGLAALCADTESLAHSKVDAVFRHRKIIEYSERIRVEFAVLVEECISDAMHKADRIAAGDLGDSSGSSSGEEYTQTEEQSDQSSQSLETQGGSPGTTTQQQPTQVDLHRAPTTTSDKAASSVAVSSRSSSSMECPTPRSRRSLAGILGQPAASKRSSVRAESDAADSDSSAPSSVVPSTTRTESPLSERGASRAASTGEGKRRSLILPGVSSSSRRESPARNQPHSPLRLSKPPRLSAGESLPSPTTSPLLMATELAPSNYQSHHRHHHRRQSSTASPDLGKPPISPHLTSAASHPPPRAIAPSIKDFEIIKPISKGAFGSVYLSKKKSTGEYFAIKVLKKADMVAKNQVTNVKAERAIMMWQGESEFVAKLYWTFSSKDYLYLVMEYSNGGDCASLVKVLGGLPEDWAKKYIAEVVLGVEHLHGRGIVHRDLKPDNLLIDPKGHLKLTDFGLSRMGLVGRQKRIQKSPNDSAPDLLKQGPFTRAEASIGSSRSASFDFPPTQSPNSTPLITPEVGSLGQPSYFNLNKEPSLSREPSRRQSGYRSDSGGSDSLGAMFRHFSLHDGESPPISYHPSQQYQHHASGGPIEEEAPSEESDSPHLFPVHSASHSLSGQHNTPPQQSMIPPAMALFDPADQNRCFVGTPDYLAPETIDGSGQDETSDWWSLGCILFEFLYGYPPFNAGTPDEVFENILNRRINWPPDADELVSPEAMDLMNTLMTLNPQERLGSNTAEKFASGGAEICHHPWLADVNYDTLLEDEAQFVPAPSNPEDTEYFDARGASLQAFPDELEDQLSPQSKSGGEYQDRPHDALFKVKTQSGSHTKRGLMPLHIPPHVRDSRSRRLSEPTAVDDFGNFSFKNLPILERANKDVIQKLKNDAMQAQQRQTPQSGSGSGSGAGSANAPASTDNKNPPALSTSTSSSAATTAGPSLEGSPLIPMPLQKTKVANRPASPSALSQANSSSPNRASQPSSPLLVQFSTEQQQHHHQRHHRHERRKTSGSSATFSPQSNSSSQTGGFEPPRLSTNMNMRMSASAASSPVKHSKMPVSSPEGKSQQQQQQHVPSLHRQASAPGPRPRSHTLGSQDSDVSLPKDPFVPGHHKRRSQLFDVSPSSSDNEDPRAKALLKVQRRRQSSRRLSQITLAEGPVFRPLDVLICEDHPVSRLVLERLFEKLRCRTITAVNGSEAMRFALSEVQFDIILTEFKLPQINGADVARMVRDTKSVNTNTPIIAVTGYLKDLPDTHHFDWLIEKPPTLPKLAELLSKFCHWKPPRDDAPHPTPPPPPAPPRMRHLSLKKTSAAVEDSPSSVSSGFVPPLSSSYKGSSREDSIGSSSYFDDLEPVKGDEIPVITNRPPTDEWKYASSQRQHHQQQQHQHQHQHQHQPQQQQPQQQPQQSGLGISEETPATQLPKLTQVTSAPATLHLQGNVPPRKTTTTTTTAAAAGEGSQTKRETLDPQRYEGAESGDDEDEELETALGLARSESSNETYAQSQAQTQTQTQGQGQGRPQSPSPQSFSARARRSSSKLGTEMMRTNSRGSVVSSSEEAVGRSGESGNVAAILAGSGAEPEATATSTTTTTAVTSAQNLDESLERVHLAEEGLGVLPEDPEKEESCTSSLGQGSETAVEEGRDTAGSDTPSRQDTMQKRDQTPPEIPPPTSSSVITPDPRTSTKENLPQHCPDDDDATPRPFAHQTGRGDGATPEGEADNTPRASGNTNREGSRTRTGIMKWIHR